MVQGQGQLAPGRGVLLVLGAEPGQVEPEVELEPGCFGQPWPIIRIFGCAMAEVTF